MAFLDVFKSERKQRELYGISNGEGKKLLILTYLLFRVSDPYLRGKLIAEFQRENRGVSYIPVPVKNCMGGQTVPIADNYLTQTISRVLRIKRADLPVMPGNDEELIAAYINANDIIKEGETAELWVELE